MPGSRLFWTLAIPASLAAAATGLFGALGGDTAPARVAAGLGAALGASLIASAWAWRQTAPVARAVRRLRDGAPPGLALGAPQEHDSEALAELAAAYVGWVAAKSSESGRQRGQLDALIDGQDDPAFITDGEGRLERCNEAAARLLGASASSLRGRAVRGLFTRSDLVAAHEAAARGRRGRLRVGLPSSSGERVFEVVVTPLEPGRGGAGSPTATVMRDVTELAETLRIKTDFVANASHELRTPLAAIRAGVETLSEGAKHDPKMLDRVLEMIAQHVARLEELTRDLLDLARLEQQGLALRVEPLIVEKLVAGLRAEMEPAARQRSLKIDFDIDPTFDGAAADPRLLFVALRNLLDNATKFCHEGTTVRVRGRWASGGGGDDPRAGTLRFEVQDEGIGIPLNQQQRVFERFYQVDPGRSGFGAQRRGTGLGLAITRHAVRAMGGRIGLESLWQKGTTVWIEAPTPPEPPDADGGDEGAP